MRISNVKICVCKRKIIYFIIYNYELCESYFYLFFNFFNFEVNDSFIKYNFNKYDLFKIKLFLNIFNYVKQYKSKYILLYRVR